MEQKGTPTTYTSTSILFIGLTPLVKATKLVGLCWVTRGAKLMIGSELQWIPVIQERASGPARQVYVHTYREEALTQGPAPYPSAACHRLPIGAIV
jgi:hypothetical protein